MQIFLQSRGTDWSALFCASKPACSCIYRDGRCLTDSGMTQPAPVFFYIFSAAVRLRYSWQVHSYYGGKEDDLSYDWGTFRQSQVVSDPVTSAKDILLYTILQNFSKTWHGHADYDLYLDEVANILFHWHIISQGDYNRLLAYERKRKNCYFLSLRF